MPEVTENYIRIPNPKHKGTECKKIRTITISSKKGIKALYCVDHKKIKTYLFDKDKWNLSEAKKWVQENAKGIIMDKKLFIKAIIEKTKDRIIGVASEEIEDRDGEILSLGGWELKNFRKNPQLLYYHNMRPERSLPIGKVTNIGVRQVDGKKKLVFTAMIEEITEFGRTIKKFIEDGFLNSFSVGFQPKEREGNKYTRQELLEISVVPVPSLPSAVILDKSAKEGMNQDCVNALLGDKEAQKKVIKEQEKLHKDGKDGLDGGEMNKSESKGVVPYRGYDTAPEGLAWNVRESNARIKRWAGGANKEDIDFDKYQKAFTWFNASDVKNFESYKLPHHDIDAKGDVITVWRGVAASMAVLLGARGGVGIPEGASKAVYGHLKKHYAQFNKEAPDFRLVELQAFKGRDEELGVYTEELQVEKLFRAIKNLKREMRKRERVNEQTRMLIALKILNRALSIAIKNTSHMKGGEQKK